MVRKLTICAALIAFGAAANVNAQSSPSRPPLFFSEHWQPLKTPTDDHGAWPASQGGVASARLTLSLHGASGKEIQLVAVRGQTDLYPMNLWTGTTTSPSAASLRDADNFVDLSDPLAKIRWTVRTSGFHQVRPIVKLADGTWLIGDHATGPSVDFNVDDISIASLRWLKLDVDRVVTVGDWVANPDLRKVDEVGFADLLPGSGHGPGGYANVAGIEVFGRPIKR